MSAWYNEIDPKAAAWLRELIKQGHIAPGVVDERSIEDIRPDELTGYTQCHFFAGIGVWSYALRSAGWPDDRPVWTGSCPCQPFSQAGKGAGTSDERHLWPAFYHLIEHGKPQAVPVFGEQVASKAGRAWLDVVQADLENLGLAFGALDICAAGAGAPHIRQRLYWVAESDSGQRGGGPVTAAGNDSRGADAGRPESHRSAAVRGEDGGMADADGGHTGSEREQRSGEQRLLASHGCPSGLLAHDDDAGRFEHAQCDREPLPGCQAPALGDDAGGCGGLGELGNPGGGGSGRDAGAILGAQSRAERCLRGELDFTQPSGVASQLGHHHHEGLEGWRVSGGECSGERTAWSPSDFIWCRDGKWRPVEPGTFPLAHGAPARVGRLRGYGNAIVAPLAAEFIKAYAGL